MDPLSALAIAAAVFQFVDLGSRVLTKAWAKRQILRGTARDKRTEENLQFSKELLASLDCIQATCKGLRDSNSGTTHAATPAQLLLLRLCKDCESLAVEFHDALSNAGKATPNGPENAQERLEGMKRQIVDCLILCIWYVGK